MGKAVPKHITPADLRIAERRALKRRIRAGEHIAEHVCNCGDALAGDPDTVLAHHAAHADVCVGLCVVYQYNRPNASK